MDSLIILTVFNGYLAIKPHRLTLTKRAKITELPLKNNIYYAAPQA